MSDIIVRILFISYFFKLHVALEENFTYVNTELSWIEASRYCYGIGLVLANNKIDIKNSLHHSNIQTPVWIGEYEELTEWAYIKGCFNTDWDINNESINVRQGDRLTCQKLCNEHLYFGEKEGICSCFDDLTNYAGCNCSYSNCLTVWQHHLENFSNDDDENKNCIVVTGCDQATVKRTNERCDVDLQTTCENGDIIDYGLKSQLKSAEMCFERGSFIKWYTNDECHPGSIKGNRWTSGRREIRRFSIFKYDNVESERLLKCFSYDGKTENIHKKDQCVQTEDEKTFFCREENNVDWVYPKNEVTDKKQSSSVGIVLGVVFVTIGIAVAAALLVIFIKRRTKKKRDNQNQARIPVSVSKSGYSCHVTQSSKIQTHKTDYDYSSVTEINHVKNVTVNYDLAKPIKDEKGGDYSFAQPIQSDGDYAYNSDYDHLNTSIKQLNDSEHYMSAGQAKREDDKMETYNHLSSFDRKTNDEESCSNSNYDHLRTITGSDPTYDVSGDVIHDDSDKYDHLPPNFKTDRSSSDYQSTKLFPGRVKDESYDHFELKDVK